MTGKETELKLAIEPQALASLKRHPVVKAHQQARPVTQTLSSVYYDTPDRRLAQAGITVRLRSAGQDRLQTVKTAGSRVSGLFSRKEWEGRIRGDELDQAMLAATGLPLLQDPGIVACLAPHFTTTVSRRLYVLRGSDWEVELALDQGEITADGHRLPICEAELELRNGNSRHLFLLARQLVETLPARLLVQSKSDRGNALAAGEVAGAVKAGTVALDSETSLTVAFQAIARDCLHHLLANERALLEQDAPEAVHQMRVALRRLRSALKVFRPLVAGPELARLKGELKWLLGVLGPARDSQVFLSEIIEPAMKSLGSSEELCRVRETWQQRQAQAHKAARAAVESRRFTAMLLDFGAWVEETEWSGPGQSPALPTFVESTLDKLWRKMRKAAGKDIRQLDPSRLHQFRIMGKRLRYAGEFFAPLHGKAAKGFLVQLAQLQDKLGAINDLATANAQLSALHHPAGTAWAAGQIAGWHEARHSHLLADARKTWKAMLRHRRYWAG